jgi:hypothetical protein
MTVRLITVLLLFSLPLASACTSSDYLRTDGITVGAGEAIAANTVMQLVDPWQPGVEDTDLVTPADLDQYRKPNASAADPGATQPASIQ